MRILVIDDYRSHGESLVETLVSLGHEGLYAPSYAEAEWLLDLFEFDLALVDLDMPGMSGAEVTTRLRKRSPRLISVIMSGRSADDETIRREVRDAQFMEKPLTVRALQDLIEKVGRESMSHCLVLRQGFPIAKHEERPRNA